MNEQDFIKALTEVTGDPEDEHYSGDTILLDALRHLGYLELAKLFEKRRQDWWYA